MKSGYISYKGANIYYQIEGAGKPLLLLHGNGEDMTVFDSIKKYFTDRTLVFVDTRGHGKSNIKAEPLNFEILASDINYVIKELGLLGVDAIGFSDGANILYKMSCDNNIFDKIIAISGNINYKGIKLIPLVAIICMRLFYYLGSIFSKNAKRLFYLFTLMVCEPRMTFNDLKAINEEYLIITGTRDIIKIKHSKAIKDNIKHSKIKVFKKHDHFAIKKHPLELAEVINDFLKDDFI